MKKAVYSMLKVQNSFVWYVSYEEHQIDLFYNLINYEVKMILHEQPK